MSRWQLYFKHIILPITDTVKPVLSSTQKNHHPVLNSQLPKSWNSIPLNTKISTPINPLAPGSDQHLISPYHITPVAHMKVMRIKEMITN